MLKAEIRIGLKKGVADPEGQNAKKALELLGYKNVNDVSAEKIFVVQLDMKDPAEAQKVVENMCQRLFANPVIHDYQISLQ
ncbi:MAG: phosphoribosylformylglycinamidine synthase subunit PurS [Thermoplasmata archaeon]|nr:MAG: phosphoribosylformylglycinamidine synthase subunit PurS [Thermoplasmata archaeon]